MKAIEKRDFIRSHLQYANESILNEFYEKLRKEEVLKSKLVTRANMSEADILSGRVLTRAEIEKRTENLGCK